MIENRSEGEEIMSAGYSRRSMLGLLAGLIAGCAPLPRGGPLGSATPAAPTPRPPAATPTRVATPASAGPTPTARGEGATPAAATPRAASPVISVPTAATTASPAGPRASSPTARPQPADAEGTTGLGAFPLPTHLRIPKIRVDALVETVGLETSGAMQKPSAPDLVAWYGYGPPPGWPGAAVVAGHVDSVRGPAVFWSLQDLHPGDGIEVEVLGSQTRRFVVDSSSLYVPEAAPIDLIFSPSGPPRLNLITCGGVFDRSRHAYDHRLVVFTHPESSAN